MTPSSYLEEVIVDPEGLDGNHVVVDLESDGGRVVRGGAALGSGVHVDRVPVWVGGGGGEKWWE